MRLIFRLHQGDEISLWVEKFNSSDATAGDVIHYIHTELLRKYKPQSQHIQIQVFLGEVRIRSHRTLGEQGVVDGSVLTVHWVWSEEQRKNIKCLTFDERIKEYEKRKNDMTSKRKAFFREKGRTEEELASLGFLSGCKRKRSPSLGRAGYDTYMLYNAYTGKVIKGEEFTEDEPEEARMLDMGEVAAIELGVRPEQIKMHKEFDITLGECKVFVSVSPWEHQMV